jgi:hypothetical protein
MEQVDERILEFLDSTGWATPRIMAREQGFEASEGRIRERCKRLQYAGFVVPLHGETYEITRWGILYLDGEIDAEHQLTPTVDSVL